MRKKGTGTVYRKGDHWVVRVRRTDEFGRRIERSVIATSKSEAVSKAKTLQASLDQGPTLPKDIRLGPLFDHLIETVYQGRVRSSTLNLYKGLLRNHLHVVRDVFVQRLTPALLDELFSDKSKGLRTRQLLRRVMIGFLNHAVRLGYIADNPAKKTLPVSGQGRIVEPLTSKEVRAILEATKSQVHRAAFRTQVELGLRVGELLGIRWPDIKMQTRTVTIRQQLLRDRVTGELDLCTLKTHKSTRTLPLTDELMAVIDTLPHCGVFVFTSTAGGPLDPRNYNRALSEAAKKAGIGHVSSHRLRHSYATWALGLGVDIAIISRAMGHSSISMTARYAAATPEVIRKANEKVSSLLN